MIGVDLLPDERFKPWPGTDGFFVSNKGRVISLKSGKPHLLRSNTEKDRDPYVTIPIIRNGYPAFKSRSVSTNMLMVFGYYNPAPEMKRIVYLDKKSWNCSMDNVVQIASKSYYENEKRNKHS
jgi:hypothetical protein